MSIEDGDRDDRTIYVGGLSEKVTDKLFYELFFQAGPIERVSIPKEKDGKIKTFGFVTYKHLASVQYAIDIFGGTKLYGKELMLKNRSTNNSNRNSYSNHHQQQQIQQPQLLMPQSFQSNPLLNALNSPQNMMPAFAFPQQQQLIGQQLLQQQLSNFSLAMQNFNMPSNTDAFPSTRNDSSGSQRERDLVDRNRYHRDDDRNFRNKPYRRSRSRSPSHNRRDRSRSPINAMRRDRERDRDRRREGGGGGSGGGYSRWNYRK